MAKKRKSKLSDSLPEEFVAKLKSITAKRAKTVIDHIHVALRTIRRMDITWTEMEVADFERLNAIAKRQNLELPAFVKIVLGSGTK